MLRTKMEPQSKPNFLPIKAWYLGHKYFEEPYHLFWESTDKMSIGYGVAEAVSRHTEEVDLPWVAKEIWFWEANDYSDKVLGVETFEQPTHSNFLGYQYSGYFRQGPPLPVAIPSMQYRRWTDAPQGGGNIVIKFDGSSSAWSGPVYKTFVDWLNVIVQYRSVLRGFEGNEKWETAHRFA
ncbi:hypothetical protein DFH07DRAFT_385692 [Mycena maculata]|uniref:Uncharacterized protein n=1 Tax=Mycena maculata TaxID=230809 RepID=A0AAD7KB41_9AGAR|nr:hypothetical protein DFH07DRAFT_385692 [Mycena maculata]